MSEEDSTKPEDYRQGIRESFATYAWVWRELLNDEGRRAAKRLTACLCLGNLISMTIPWFLGSLVSGLEKHDGARIVRAFIGVCSAFLIRRVIQYFESHQREIMFGSNQGSIDLRTNELFMEKSMGQHLREHDVLSAAGMEKGRMRASDTIILMVNEGGETMFLLLTSYAALWFLSVVAGLASTAIFIVYICWSLFLNRRVAEVCVPLDVQFRAFNRYREERWERIERVKANGKESEECQHLTSWWAKLIHADRTFWIWFSNHCTLRSVVSTLLLLLVMGHSTWQSWNGLRPYGELFPLFIWMQNILDNIWRLGNFEHRISWNLPSVQSLRTALTMKPDVVDREDATQLDVREGVRVEFCDVTHTYQPGTSSSRADTRKVRPVLKGVSFTVEPGEVVALLGRSGAGKSTIMQLLKRATDPEAGTIRINGCDLRELQLTSWLQRIGNIPQAPAVLSGSLKYNILYGLTPEERKRVADEDVWALMRRLCIDYGPRLTDGLETRVGRNGIELSGGEQQRLMIGAAVAKQPHFMLIDEATSALDSTTERSVQEGLVQALSGGTGALIIAHRLSTVRNVCDKFVVLRSAEDLTNGEPQIEAVASSFEELSQLSPTFRQLAHDQGITIPSS
jgi:ABC-type multidrug transport system fused ATPase/permease subunit